MAKQDRLLKDKLGLAVDLEVQDSKTLRSVAVWLEGSCTSHRRGRLHMFCEDCVRDLYKALRQGRLPGEKV